MLYEYYPENGAKVLITSEIFLTLEQEQGLVGGLIEFARGEDHGRPGLTLCANEEGLLIGSMGWNKRSRI